MKLRRALTFLFQDPRWVGKLGIAMVLNLVPAALIGNRLITGSPLQATAFDLLWAPLVGLAMVPLFGFLLRITRNVVAGHDVPLPEWSAFGGLLRDGLKLWGVVSLWALPAGLARIAASPLAGDGSGGGWPAIDATITVVSLIVFVVQPAAEARLAVTGSLVAGLDVPAVFATVRRNLGGYLRLPLVLLVGVGVGIGLSMGLVALVWRALGGAPSRREITVVGMTVAFVLLLPYTQFALYHLFGQVYARAQIQPRRHMR